MRTMLFFGCFLIAGAQGSAATPLFCTDPYTAICSNAATHRLNRLKSNQIILEKALAEETNLFLKKYHLAQTKKPTLNLDNYRFDDQVIANLYQRAKPNIQSFQMTQVQILKENLGRAIDASTLSPQEKNKFKNYVHQETFVTFTDSSVCGRYGINPLAQAEDTEETRKTAQQKLKICIGFYLFHSAEEELTDQLGKSFMITTHEMSHIMSDYWEPNLYSQFNACILQTSGKRILSDYLQSYAKNTPASEIDPHYRKEVLSHLAEIVAAHTEEITSDYWAKEAVAQYLEHEGAVLNTDQKLRFLQNAYGYFCTADDMGSHPSGQFRIELMGNDPKIRKAMSCDPQSNPISCDLDGIVR